MSINKAFIDFQKEFKGLKPDAKNPFFKSTYISLDGILETVRPILAKNGLAVLQEATGDGEYVFVKTKLLHESGEVIETDLLKMKPQKNDAQQMGSCITYAKRYQLGALLGICESIDDDGNKATFGKAKPTDSKENDKTKKLYEMAQAKGFTTKQVVDRCKAKYKKVDVDKLTDEEYKETWNALEGAK